MVNEKRICPIWGAAVTSIEGTNPLDTEFLVKGSPRTGGDYRIEELAKDDVGALDDKDKAKLTTILLELRRAGDRAPLVTSDLVEKAKRADLLPVHVRAERLLRYLVDIPKDVGQPLGTQRILDGPEAAAWSESNTPEDVEYFVDYLTHMGWLKRHSSGVCLITVSGYQHVAEQSTQKDLYQCFVAMWFDASMNPAYEDGIKKAVEECGYKPLRIDKKPDVNKIDDEIVAEIRRSRFVVADFTHEKEKGARGGVYYEAGFAHGLGLPVIYSCHKGLVEELHFDTRQYHHILWQEAEDLCTQLKHRIRAIVGDNN